MTVAQLDEHLTVDEFFEWMAYDNYLIDNVDDDVPSLDGFN